MLIVLFKACSYKQTAQLTQTLICCSNSSSIAIGGFNCQFKKSHPAVTQGKDDLFKHKSGCLQMFLLYCKEFLIWFFIVLKQVCCHVSYFGHFGRTQMIVWFKPMENKRTKKKGVKFKSARIHNTLFFSYFFLASAILLSRLGNVPPNWQRTAHI